jgi:hypothetical protein
MTYLIVMLSLTLVRWWKRDYIEIPNGPVQLEEQARRLHETAKDLVVTRMLVGAGLGWLVGMFTALFIDPTPSVVDAWSVGGWRAAVEYIATASSRFNKSHLGDAIPSAIFAAIIGAVIGGVWGNRRASHFRFMAIVEKSLARVEAKLESSSEAEPSLAKIGESLSRTPQEEVVGEFHRDARA